MHQCCNSLHCQSPALSEHGAHLLPPSLCSAWCVQARMNNESTTNNDQINLTVLLAHKQVHTSWSNWENDNNLRFNLSTLNAPIVDII